MLKDIHIYAIRYTKKQKQDGTFLNYLHVAAGILQSTRIDSLQSHTRILKKKKHLRMGYKQILKHISSLGNQELSVL